MTAGLSSKLRVLARGDVGGTTYKPSRYNHFVDKGDFVWGVNFFSNSFVRIPKETYRKVQRVLDGERSEALEGVKSNLVKGKFLIPDAMDEMKYLKTRNHMSRFGNKGLTLIVAPTLRCNFGCEYCYVDLNANKMKPEDRVKLGKFFYNKLPEGTKAQVVWTGGDPSLAMDAVEDISHRFLDACEKKGSPYYASLITNGYLLHDEMRAKLKSSKIERLQISIDGSKEFHDNTRYLPKGEPTYDRIMANVEDTVHDFNVFLRINVDRKNHAAIPDLLEDITRRGLNQRLWVYFAHVYDANENSAAYRDNCLEHQHYARVEAELMRLALSQGFNIGNGGVLKKPISTFCGANSKNYFVVDSKVNLLKCYHDFGAADQHGIGHIADDGQEVVTNPYNLMKWLGWDPFEIKECTECKVLPVCMGGCSHKIMHSDMQVENGCARLRFSMDEIVDLYGELKTQDLSSGCSGCAVAAEA